MLGVVLWYHMYIVHTVHVQRVFDTIVPIIARLSCGILNFGMLYFYLLNSLITQVLKSVDFYCNYMYF